MYMKFQEQFWPTEDLDKWFKDKKIVSQMSVFSEKGVFSRKYMEKKFYDEWHKPQRNIFIYSTQNKEQKNNDLEGRMEIRITNSPPDTNI